MNLRSIDLNLLPILEAIYVERSLTRASATLNITQPAVSNALARLRAHFEDPLFLREGRGMRPTAMTEALMPSVRDALDRLRSSLEPKSTFDPDSSTRVFNISSSDTSAFVLAPRLAQIQQQAAPNIRLRWFTVPRATIPLELASGRLDIAIDIPGIRGTGLASTELYAGDMVCILSPDHPLAGKQIDLQTFLSLRHVTVSSRREGLSLIEQMLRAVGHQIIPTLRMQTHFAALEVVRHSELVLSAPASVAVTSGLSVQPLPFDSPPLPAVAYWHKQREDDPGTSWLRETICSLSADI